MGEVKYLQNLTESQEGLLLWLMDWAEEGMRYQEHLNPRSYRKISIMMRKRVKEQFPSFYKKYFNDLIF